MSSFSRADHLIGLPGYLETLRLVQGAAPNSGSMFKPAWSKLELFPTAAALDFLTPKFEKAIEIKDPEAQINALIEITLGFGIMAVLADRENNAYIDEMAQRVAEVSTVKKAEQEIEHEAIHGQPDIDW